MLKPDRRVIVNGKITKGNTFSGVYIRVKQRLLETVDNAFRDELRKNITDTEVEKKIILDRDEFPNDFCRKSNVYSSTCCR